MLDRTIVSWKTRALQNSIEVDVLLDLAILESDVVRKVRTTKIRERRFLVTTVALTATGRVCPTSDLFVNVDHETRQRVDCYSVESLLRTQHAHRLLNKPLPTLQSCCLS